MAVSLDLAISAIRSGRKEEGRQLLNLLIQQNPNDEKAWLWMSSVVEADEQRARCLYHVLAINPNSQIARQGLEVLGIVVSDSRPVKIPRDSRPIKIPRPSKPQADSGERRPFLIDPKTVTDELPFTPINAPFTTNTQTGALNPTTSANQETLIPTPASVPVSVSVAEEPSRPIGAVETPAAQQEPVKSSLLAQLSVPELSDTQELGGPSQQPVQPSEPVPIVNQTPQPPQVSPFDSQPVPVPTTLPHPSEPIPVINNNGLGQLQHPSEPVPVVSAQNNGGIPAPLPGHMYPQPVQPGTRPSQPVPVTYPQNSMGQPQSTDYYPPPPLLHANPTMGMPPPQPIPSAQLIHSNTTMGMPVSTPYPYNQHPAEPMLVVHSNATLGMSPYGQPQPMPQNMAIHSNSTMMMPTLSEAEARARLATSQAIPTQNATAMALQNAQLASATVGMPQNYEYFEEDDEEEVNLLAVIIFGTLSVTALGGLGMLILLVFTAPTV